MYWSFGKNLRSAFNQRCSLFNWESGLNFREFPGIPLNIERRKCGDRVGRTSVQVG